MFWKSSKGTKAEIVKYLNRVLLQTPGWNNTGFDIVALPDDVGETTKRLAIEQFAFEREKYPMIAVWTAGVRQVDTAFNNQIGQLRNEYPVGVFGTGVVSTANGQVVFQQLGSSFAEVVIKGVEVHVRQAGVYQEELFAGLGYVSGGVVTYLSKVTGSVLPEDGTHGWQKLLIPFPSTGSVSTTVPTVIAFWSDGAYQLMTDPDTSLGGSGVGFDQFTLPTINGPDVVCTLEGPQVFRHGGLDEVVLNLRVQAINDVIVTENVAELTARYLKLARYYKVDLNYEDSLKHIDRTVFETALGELHAKGIYVGDVSEGAEEQRRRGDNDIIYQRTITCTVRTEWGKDVPVEEPTDIEVLEPTEFTTIQITEDNSG